MNLTDQQRDTLAELINIGFSRTASSLSEITGQRVLMDTPTVAIHPVAEVLRQMNGLTDGRVASIHQMFSGPLTGDALLAMRQESATMLADLLTGQTGSPASGVMDESAREVLAEVGNILLNACLGMLANLLKVRLSFAVPRVYLEKLETLMGMLASEREGARCALVVSTGFRLGQSAVEGWLVVMLGAASLEQLLQALGHWERESTQPSAPRASV